MITFASSRIPSAFLESHYVVTPRYVVRPKYVVKPKYVVMPAGITAASTYSVGGLAGSSSSGPHPPTLTAPTNNSTVQTGLVAFSWTLDPSTTTTNLRICGGPGGTGVCHVLGNNPGDVTASYTLQAATYYVSMNSVLPDGTQGPWSADTMFTVLPVQPGQAPPPPPGQSACTLPMNPRAGQYGSVDPFFGSQADHDNWALAHPTCNVPAYMPDNYLPMLPAIPGVPANVSPWIWYGVAGVVVYGAGYLVWAAMQPRAAASVSTSTPASSTRRNPSTRTTFKRLPIGSEFRFASEEDFGPASGFARGPWRKISDRKYVDALEQSSANAHRVGSVSVKVIK